MKVFRLTVEFELEDDLNLVIGAVTGVDHFDGTVHVSLEHVEKFTGTSRKENDDDDDSGE